MSMQSEGNDAKGRNYDNVTKSNSTSAGSLGAGGTGGSDDGAGNRQSNDAGNVQGNTPGVARTDDLLSPDAGSEQSDSYQPTEQAGELQTGLGGIGSLSTGNAGNRQSDGDTQPGGERTQK